MTEAADRIFALWTGDNDMPEIRKAGLATFGSTGLHPTLVTPANLHEWVLRQAPLHPAYDLLSPVHRSDYLRPYLMYHHGGGYADIKPQGGSWLPAIAKVKASRRLMATGYAEVRGGTVWLNKYDVDGRYWVGDRERSRLVASGITHLMRVVRPLMIGNCAFWFKPRTPFARAWLHAVERRLDMLLPELKNNPPAHIRDYRALGSGYPVPWAFLMGEVFHPLTLRYMHRLDRSLPHPRFTNYREGR